MSHSDLSSPDDFFVHYVRLICEVINLRLKGAAAFSLRSRGCRWGQQQ